MENVFSFRRFGYAVAALVVVVASGALGYHAALDETWLQSVYRSVVTVSLTGLDSVPRNDSSRLLTIGLVLAGITIFAYIGSLVVEAIARGVLGDVWADRRRRRAIESLHDHYIICGFGCARSIRVKLRNASRPATGSRVAWSAIQSASDS